MSGTTTANWAQYSRWAYIVPRVLKSNLPANEDAVDLLMPTLRAYVKYFWNQKAQTGTRPWLATAFLNRTGISYSKGAHTAGDPDYEPARSLLTQMEVIARDVKKIPLTAGEKTRIDTLIAATSDMRYGAKYTYGNLV